MEGWNLCSIRGLGVAPWGGDLCLPFEKLQKKKRARGEKKRTKESRMRIQKGQSRERVKRGKECGKGREAPQSRTPLPAEKQLFLLPFFFNFKGGIILQECHPLTDSFREEKNIGCNQEIAREEFD